MLSRQVSHPAQLWYVSQQSGAGAPSGCVVGGADRRFGGSSAHAAPRNGDRCCGRCANQRMQQTRQALDLVSGIGAQLMRKYVRQEGDVVHFARRIGIPLLVVFALGGCASGPDAVLIPIAPSASPADIAVLQRTIESDDRVLECVYTWTNDSESGDESCLKVGLPAGQSQSDLDALLVDIESCDVFDQVVLDPQGQWWDEQ